MEEPQSAASGSPPGDTPAESSVAAGPAPAHGMRYVLYTLFGVTLLGLAYDQLARYEARSAWDLVETAIQNQDPISRLKADAVHTLLDREPDSKLSDADSEREIYHWRGTLQSYDVTVEYSKEGGLRDVRLGGQ